MAIGAFVHTACGDDGTSPSDTAASSMGTQSGTGGSTTSSPGPVGGPSSSTALTSGTSAGTAGDTVSYARDVAPIFKDRCTDCHHQAVTAIPNIADPFDPSNGIITFPNTWNASHPDTPALNVVPGDPSNSFLVQKISDPNIEAGAPMPWSPERVTVQEAADLRQWVTLGALNDAFYQSNVRRIFGNPGALGPPGGKCNYCHHAAGIAPNLADPFDPVNGVVNVAATIAGWTRVIPGDPDNSLLITKVEAAEATEEAGDPMPKVYPRLTVDEIQTVTQWILEGAQNN